MKEETLLEFRLFQSLGINSMRNGIKHTKRNIEEIQVLICDRFLV
jgi:hypothetical protein